MSDLVVTGISFVAVENGPVLASLRIEDGALVIGGVPGINIRIEADEASVSINGDTVHAHGKSVARVEGPVVELHASQALKEDAGGVGHTYTPSAAHFWVPLEGGTSNWPHPPEHPLYGNDNLTGPKP